MWQEEPWATWILSKLSIIIYVCRRYVSFLHLLKANYVYAPIRYYACQQLTEKSDVYSFGVVLLELISGRKPVSQEDYGAELNIVHWVWTLTFSHILPHFDIDALSETLCLNLTQHRLS